jgi:hypothetical protein
MHRPPVFAILILFAGSAGAQVQHWTETLKETIWRSRYTNCDMGYAVDLPNGVVGHGGLPPMPNHGVLISASDPGATAEVTLADQRVLDVYDEYDALELGSARAYLNWELRQMPNKKSLRVREIVFRGFPAAEARYRVDETDSSELVIYRKGVPGDAGSIYVLSLHTTARNYTDDYRLFTQIRAGFHLLPLPKGACSNP